MSILTVQETKNSEKEIREKHKSKYSRQESSFHSPTVGDLSLLFLKRNTNQSENDSPRCPNCFSFGSSY